MKWFNRHFVRTIIAGLACMGFAFGAQASASEEVLYSFSGDADGALPYAPLAADRAGNLYGSTLSGGANGYGTIFKLTPKGAFTTLCAFTGEADGDWLRGGVTYDETTGKLFGTTTFGGAKGYGTIFALQPSGTITILHNFTRGADSEATMVRDKLGNFNGTTRYGGTHDDGTVFKLAVDGAYSVLHNFTGRKDGRAPVSRLLIESDGSLVGTLRMAALTTGAQFTRFHRKAS